jgi:hypothetical protein
MITRTQQLSQQKEEFVRVLSCYSPQTINDLILCHIDVNFYRNSVRYDETIRMVDQKIGSICQEIMDILFLLCLWSELIDFSAFLLLMTSEDIISFLRFIKLNQVIKRCNFAFEEINFALLIEIFPSLCPTLFHRI